MTQFTYQRATGYFLIAQVSDIGSHHQQQQASLFGCFPLVGNRLVIMLFCRICKQGSHSTSKTWKTWKNESTPGKPGNIMEF